MYTVENIKLKERKKNVTNTLGYAPIIIFRLVCLVSLVYAGISNKTEMKI